MSSLSKSEDVNLESANCDCNSQAQVTKGGGGGPHSSDGTEIVRAVSGSNGCGSGGTGDDDDKKKGSGDKRRESSVSVEILDLESGPAETKLHELVRIERDCRICHLSMDATNQECGLPIELGCSCKDDLAAAHKQCAEAWFKIKGNKTCEICGSIAQNVTGQYEAESTEQWTDESNDGAATARTSASLAESRNFWRGHRFLNFLLACMVFAFIISWLFHINVPS